MLLGTLRTNAVQHHIANCITTEINDRYDIPASVGKVEIFSINEIALKDVLLLDLNGDTVLHTDEARAHLDTRQLFNGKIRINTASLASPRIKLNRETPDSALNIQYLLDIFNNGEKKESKVDLRLNQLTVYEGKFTYDILNTAPDSPLFNPNHIAIDDLGCNISLKRLDKEGFDLFIRSISGEERCGLRLQQLRVRARMENNTLSLAGMDAETSVSNLHAEEITIDLNNGIENWSAKGAVLCERFSPADLAPFVALPPIEIPDITFTIDGFCNADSLDATLATRTHNSSLTFKGKATLTSPFTKKREGCIRIYECTTSAPFIEKALATTGSPNSIAPLLGSTSVTGELNLKKDTIDASATIRCLSGNLDASGRMTPDGQYSLQAACSNIKLGNITGIAGLEGCNIVANANGNIHNEENLANINGEITELTYNHYTYAPIAFSGLYANKEFKASLETNDSNANIKASARYTPANNTFRVTAKADSVRPYNLALTTEDKEQSYSFSLNGEHIGYSKGKKIVNLKIDNFKLTDKSDSTFIRNLYISDNNTGDERLFVFTSDFARASIYGQFEFPDIVQSLKNAVRRHIPALADAKSRRWKKTYNNFYYDANITNSKALTHILGLPFTINEPSYIKGAFNDEGNNHTIDASINNISLSGKPIRSIGISGKSNEKYFDFNAQIQRPTGNKSKKIDDNNIANDIVIRLNANIADNKIRSIVDLNDFKREQELRGMVRIDADLSKNDDERLKLNAKIFKDSILHKNDVWHISEGEVSGNLDKLTAKNISLYSKSQSLLIEGDIGRTQEDSLKVYTKGLNLGTIFDLINFRILEFDGKATGTAYVTGILSSPNAAGRFNVEDFRIDGGSMGRADVFAGWDNNKKSILLDIDLYNEKDIRSNVSGFLSQANDTITLMIDANEINIAFLNHKLKTFVVDSRGTGTGKVHLHGSWRAVDFDGAVAMHCSTKVKATNVRYHFMGDSIKFSKGAITFDNARVHDRNGNYGMLSGTINHKNLSNWTCHLTARADNLLVYDTEDFGSLPFYGTAYGIGTASIISGNNGFELKADMATAPNSRFYYNSNVTSGARDNSFVTFTDNSKARKSPSTPVKDTNKTYNTTASKMTLDFMLDINENLELKIYTNLQNDDYLILNGTGPVNAVYNDRTGFNMKGRLDLTRGAYKFTIQDIFPKTFEIAKGGSIALNGDPFKAQLNLRAKYLVPSASLSDLTTEIAKRKSVKVNCIMDITGSLQSPELKFDLELPEGSEEERELLASIASTPDQKNMQFIYLLGVGKFYTFDASNAQASDANSSTAVESLISNTISGQINNMLGKIINNGNWDISGNISTSERGWNSMEIEGMLRGRLLNNRLLINGNLGYRENPIANRNVIGDFELQWLLSPKENWSIKAYSKTNDRYFSKTDLTTQGIGTSIRFDFNRWKWWGNKKKEKSLHKKAEKAQEKSTEEKK